MGAVTQAAPSGSQGVDSTSPASAEPASETTRQSNCNVGVMVDRHDRQPQAYGSAWIDCGVTGWTSWNGYAAVDFYRDGQYLGQGFCELSTSSSCSASVTATKPSGTQNWRACVHYRVTPEGGPWAPQEGRQCTSSSF